MSAPFFPQNAFGLGAGLALTVLIGFGFGFALERGGFGSSRRLAAQFYLYDMTVFKVMFTAIVTAMIGIFGLARVGWLDLDLIWINPTYLWPQIAGGFLLGVGFIVSGYCPGTAIVASASGKVDGVLALLGVTAGIGLFGAAYGGGLEAFHHSGAFGRLLLSDLIGIDPLILALGVALMAGGAFVGVERLERRFAGRAEPGRAPRIVRGAGIAATGSLILAGIVFLAAGHSRRAADLATARENLAPLDLARHIVEGARDWSIIDLREAMEEGSETIPGAVRIGSAELADPAVWTDRLAGHQRIVLFDGGDGAAERIALPAGFRVAVLEGGFPAWRDEILAAPAPPSATSQESTEERRERDALRAFFTGAAAPAPSPSAPPAAVKAGGKKPKASGGCS